MIIYLSCTYLASSHTCQRFTKYGTSWVFPVNHDICKFMLHLPAMFCPIQPCSLSMKNIWIKIKIILRSITKFWSLHSFNLDNEKRKKEYFFLFITKKIKKRTFKYNVTTITTIAAIRSSPFSLRQLQKAQAAISTFPSNDLYLFEIHKVSVLSENNQNKFKIIINFQNKSNKQIQVILPVSFTKSAANPLSFIKSLNPINQYTPTYLNYRSHLLIIDVIIDDDVLCSYYCVIFLLVHSYWTRVDEFQYLIQGLMIVQLD